MSWYRLCPIFEFSGNFMSAMGSAARGANVPGKAAAAEAGLNSNAISMPTILNFPQNPNPPGYQEWSYSVTAHDG